MAWLLRWEPPYINGIISATYAKDPQDSKWDNDPAMKLYRSVIAKYGGGFEPNDGQVYYGVAKAETFVQVLYKAGRNLTRAGLMKALLSMNYPNKFLLPGMVQKTSARGPLHHQPDATRAVQRDTRSYRYPSES